MKLGLAWEAAAGQTLSNIGFRAMDVYAWAERGGYDLVYCRNVLQHPSRPVEVLRNMWQAVRDGRVIVVEDADFEGSFCDRPTTASPSGSRLPAGPTATRRGSLLDR